MLLSKLDIFGFKSFAKKISLSFNEGTTAIVGPNGCGKSNIVDAIRWVFGEQRPSVIRSEKMEEVIFNGTSKRRPLGIAEVSLTLNNENGFLPIEFSEVVITRRLYRSGESDYLINKQRCRLMDIHNLFMDRGVSADYYSIFERSMIDAVLSEKTEERRRIFEEAAGITKYKVRVHSTMLKLSQTENDLAMVDNIIMEIEAQVNSLKRQASRARAYKRLREDIKRSSIAIAFFERRRFIDRKNEEEERLTEFKGRLDSLMGKVRLKEAELEKSELNVLDTEKQLQEKERCLETHGRLVSDKQQELTRLTERQKALVEMEKRSRTHLSESEEKLALNSKREVKITEKQHILELDLNAVTKQWESQKGLIDDCNGDYDKAHSEHELLVEEIRNLSDELTGKINRTAFLEDRIHEYKTNLDLLTNKKKAGKEAIENARAEIERITGEQIRFSTRIDALKKKRDEFQKDLETAKREILDLEERKKSQDEEIFQFSTERDLLMHVINSLEGYHEGVRAALNNKTHNGNIIGVLGDLLEVSEQYEKAVEAALVEGLSYVVVKNETTGKKIINYLTEEKQGRATVVPVMPTSNGTHPEYPKMECVRGRASEFVSPPEKLKVLTDKLLENTLVVDNLENALELSRDKRMAGTFAFVTLEGERVGYVGECTGGKTKEQQNVKIIGRKQKLKHLEEKITFIEEKSTNISSKKAMAEEKLYTAKAVVAEQEAQIKSATREFTLLETRVNQLAFEKLLRENEENDLAEEHKKLENTLGEYREALPELKEEIKLLNEKVKAAKRRLEDVVAVRDSISSKRDEILDLLGSLREKKATLSVELDANKRELKSSMDYSESLQKTLSIDRAEIEKTSKEQFVVAEKIKDCERETEDLSLREVVLQEEKSSFEDKYYTFKSDAQEISKQLRELRHSVEETREQAHQIELKFSQIYMEMKNVEERVSSEFNIDLTGTDIEEYEPDDMFDPENERFVTEHKKRRLEKINDINLSAEAQYEQQKRRLEFLVNERDDITRAKETLETTIRKINHTARERFLDTFKKIQVNFQKTFEELFGGGMTKLELDEGVDPLESPIYISARPKGKNIKSVNHLSTGERALTAISLLFSIYLVKPSPFCILDEVDAPLDDANIDRFLGIIKELSADTQFLIVTHNKKTMEFARVLYGVTMAEPGVSSLVSVKFNEEMEHAAG